ncbi:inositol monophosphatase [Ferrovibrio sp.]|uniref:inositol monophosphatase family protein n=1 Tax=Ferrovibrio sp. TaxID=1917215 RepID=UPI000CB056A4|nr:inositol monophosphatase [Ferrovibrio sp.]PJI37878.1 MAG: inositol-1-monophosphatase [Ferrovibrio sp.]
MKVDMDAVRLLIEGAARTTILPHFRKLESKQIDQKAGPHDVVTVADKASEEFLTPRLRDLVPGSTVVGEEASSADESIMDALRRPGYAWLIDPIDGTANFAVGSALFAVMVALVKDGDAVASWIHDPIRNITAMTEKGSGAFMREADGDMRKLKTPNPPSLAHVSGAPNLRYGDRDFAARIAYRMDKTAGVMILRCAGQEYLAMLDGHFHYAVYNRAMPWDHTAGCLLLTEAGGIAKRLDGSLYRAADKPWGSPLVAACGEEQWNWLKKDIFDA